MTCDGLDNDCDEATDEALEPPACALAAGVCVEPVAPRPCLGAAGFGTCDYGVHYQAEEADTCDALDNDCDGETDEGAACPRDRALVVVAPGVFRRGSPPEEAFRDEDETAGDVELTRTLLVRRTEVTQAEWQGVTGDNPSAVAAADRPVEQITWYDAIGFANALSERDGLPVCYAVDGAEVGWPDGLDCQGWRLPTEAEWEYLARAGTVGATWTADEGVTLAEAAWYSENSEDLHHPVGSRLDSPFGLFDVYGNVAEWVWDRYGPYPEPDPAEGPVVDPLGPADGAERVARGGAFSFRARLLRSANRAQHSPMTRSGSLGLRLVRTAPAGTLVDEEDE